MMVLGLFDISKQILVIIILHPSSLSHNNHLDFMYIVKFSDFQNISIMNIIIYHTERGQFSNFTFNCIFTKEILFLKYV